jgi:hypothetical protein
MKQCKLLFRWANSPEYTPSLIVIPQTKGTEAFVPGCPSCGGNTELNVPW